jgi:quinol monooxygenase YgiN
MAAYPLEPSERKIMLWEIWENEEAVKVHFTKKHTKDVQKTDDCCRQSQPTTDKAFYSFTLLFINHSTSVNSCF